MMISQWLSPKKSPAHTIHGNLQAAHHETNVMTIQHSSCNIGVITHITVHGIMENAFIIIKQFYYIL